MSQLTITDVPPVPTTFVTALRWVSWAVKTIGLGWHPDSDSADLVTFNRVGIEALCACGETFVPNDITDTIHAQRNDGEECGLQGVITGEWGTQIPLFANDDVRARYDDGLAAASDLLPNIYYTANERILRFKLIEGGE